ncbi:hypothetical protein H0Z60_17030 [Ectothiorhodospiraceae bacterium WFHF3C12]|nr:hypothetical protein [Ectothiorhodospiraceae bacterium WFHF3C12]
MLDTLGNIWRKHRVLSAAFIAAVVVTVFFAGRLLVFSLYWADPAHRSQPLEGWMTPRYVAHSYELPPAVVRDALGLAPGEARRHTLEQIAEESGLTLAELQHRIDAAAKAHHGYEP